MNESNEDRLIEQARAGDRAALEALLERHQEQVFRFGMKMCGNPEDASDVLQETLLAVAKGLGGFRGGSSLSTWVYTIARSFCIKNRRRSKHAPKHVESIDTLDDASAVATDPIHGPDEIALRRELGATLEDAITALEPKYREVLVLRDVEGLSAQEVAEALELSVEAVKSRLHRARVALRNRLLPILSEEPSAPGEPCSDILTLYSKKEEGEIDQSLCAEMERHLEGCARCRAACDSMKDTLRRCRLSRKVEVPEALRLEVKRSIQFLLGTAPR